jgi:hypothetical protein
VQKETLTHFVCGYITRIFIVIFCPFPAHLHHLLCKSQLVTQKNHSRIVSVDTTTQTFSYLYSSLSPANLQHVLRKSHLVIQETSTHALRLCIRSQHESIYHPNLPFPSPPTTPPGGSLILSYRKRTTHALFLWIQSQNESIYHPNLPFPSPPATPPVGVSSCRTGKPILAETHAAGRVPRHGVGHTCKKAKSTHGMEYTWHKTCVAENTHGIQHTHTHTC